MLPTAAQFAIAMFGLARRARNDDGMSLVGIVLALVAVAVIVVAAVVAFVIPGDN